MSSKAQTQADLGWGAGPSLRYDDLAVRFRPLFQRIRERAVARDLARDLPFEEINWLREAGFTALRLPAEWGGSGATLPEFFNLLIELSEADTNVTNALRSHFGFTEDVLNAKDEAWRRIWLERIGQGELIGSGFSEPGEGKTIGTYSTTLVSDGEKFIVNGEKYYTSGSLFADWINLGAKNADDVTVGALVPARAPGVDVIDDWDGFGQALSASGTTRFSDVVIDADLVSPIGLRCRYVKGFFQLVHLASLAGLGRAAASDVARLVAERTRVYAHGNGSRSSEDPQVLQVVGQVRGAAYAAGAIVLKAAEALQRVYEAAPEALDSGEDKSGVLADLEVSQAVTVVTNLILDATTILFDALGASAVKRGLGLDRYWRNARTISSHNPRIYHQRNIGHFAVNGVYPNPYFEQGGAKPS
ncbi:acyl-CoA dehydrogenase family protein [Beijerinckia indica]|uniref:Acyl-CoA dehydrogenase type 2 domain n=1 Tax=Beijerinckia indica subsp. indica (strain ATCC 9039 / DSM 1715 / NCIMB 8712) TaxID=395963 RepID=B2IIU0_BEII9|nr:acyl-CoA dehydrogenase family protein [Beijerinckia indica]ACB96152.1 Acyl-CoA dehydrogenase type 2 domain [Beijerinckia indica subsp. indica ATCC 9039]